MSTPHRNFEWDSAKEAANLKRHKLDFDRDAAGVLEQPLYDKVCLEVFDFEHSSEHEERWITTGPHPYNPHLIVRVVWTTRSDEVTRIISARKADARERKQYEQELHNPP